MLSDFEDEDVPSDTDPTRRLFIGNPDMDRAILMNVNLKTLQSVCIADRYASTLCTPTFWRQRFEKEYLRLGNSRDLSEGVVNYHHLLYELQSVRKEDTLQSMFIALREGHLKLIDYFLDKMRTEGELDDRMWEELLVIAADEGRVSVVEHLLSLTPIFNQSIANNMLLSATAHDNLALMEYLANLINNNDWEMDSDDLMQTAISYDKIDALHYLVEKLNIDPNSGRSLFIAVGEGNLPLFRYLVKKGATVDYSSLLDHAASRDRLEMVKLLIDEYGADLHGLLADEKPLVLSIFYSAHNVMRYLVDNGALVDQIRDDRGSQIEGRSPLLVAAHYRRKPAIQYMLEHGKFGHPEKRKAILYQMLTLSIGSGVEDIDLVRYLVQQGAEPSSTHRLNARRFYQIKTLLYLLDLKYDKKEVDSLLAPLLNNNDLMDEEKKLIREFQRKHRLSTTKATKTPVVSTGNLVEPVNASKSIAKISAPSRSPSKTIEPSSTPASVSDGQCQGITQAGVRCKRRCMKGEKYCSSHL